MNRRDFLAKTSALAVAAIILPRVAEPPIPVLYGDGVHDDTAALQAWFDGRPVMWRGEVRQGGVIMNGSFRVTGPVDASRWHARGVPGRDGFHWNMLTLETD